MLSNRFYSLPLFGEDDDFKSKSSDLENSNVAISKSNEQHKHKCKKPNDYPVSNSLFSEFDNKVDTKPKNEPLYTLPLFDDSDELCSSESDSSDLYSSERTSDSESLGGTAGSTECGLVATKTMKEKALELLSIPDLDFRTVEKDCPEIYNWLSVIFPVVFRDIRHEEMYIQMSIFYKLLLKYSIRVHKDELFINIANDLCLCIDKSEMNDEFVMFVLENSQNFKHIKNNCKKVYTYIMNKYPYPDDFDFSIKLSSRAYYCMFKNKMTGYPKSLVSDKYVEFDSKRDRFRYYISREEAQSPEAIKIYKDRYEATCMEKYGVRNAFQATEVKEKIKDTIQEKYGVDYITQSEKFKESYKESMQEKYGVDNISQLEEIKQKKRETTFEHFGVYNPGESEEIKEKAKKTNIERYGCENPFQSEEIKEKSRQTCLDRFGYEYSSQSPEVRKKIEQTCLERYGTTSPMCEATVKKIHDAKKKNGTFGKSKEEDVIYEALITKFGVDDVERQHKDELYPFYCDFYIKSRKMYIEYNGFWSHNFHAYDSNSEVDKQTIEEWKAMYESGHEHYKISLKVWTESDPLKRQTAKENNLNFVELWNLKEALEFVETI